MNITSAAVEVFNLSKVLTQFNIEAITPHLAVGSFGHLVVEFDCHASKLSVNIIHKQNGMLNTHTFHWGDFVGNKNLAFVEEEELIVFNANIKPELIAKAIGKYVKHYYTSTKKKEE